MPTPAWTRIVTGLAALIALAIVWASSGKLDFTYAKWIVSTTSVVILFLLVFDRWLWRYAPFYWMVSRPILHGTWKSELNTTYAARAEETIEAYLVIRQTYSRICVDMLFDRSRSRSMSGDLVQEGGRCNLYYIFHSHAHTRHREGNPPSRGAAALTIARQPQTHIEGDYWMERETGGDLKTVGYSPKIYDTFSAAQTASYRRH
jgi:SMODS-associating 2TM, beta-strand rich effector domain